MSNQLKHMQKIPTAAELAQIELQKQSFVANTRFNLASQFLNTMIGRLDIDITDFKNVTELTEVSFNYADAFMMKLGMIVQTPAAETN